MPRNHKKISADELYYLPASDYHPADTYFHFSFANYFDPNNMNFGVLRVLNDDDVTPHSGFDKHPHEDMEIVSYIVKGELTHWDSATNVEDTIGRGHVQTITAGDGVWHSELNKHDGWTRFLQIWITPPERGLPVRYENQKFELEDRLNKLLQIVGNTSNKDQVPLHLHQDVNFYVSEITDNKAKVPFSLKEGRQAYINNFEGSVNIKSLPTLDERDSLEVVGPAELEFTVNGDQAHFIIIEMAETDSGVVHFKKTTHV